MIIELIHITWRNKLLVLLITAVISAAIFTYLMIAPKTYEAIGVVRLVRLTDPTSGISRELSMIDKMSFMETHKNMLASRVVLDRLVEALPFLEQWDNSVPGQNNSLKRERLITQLRRRITLESVKFTDLLQIIIRYKKKKEVAVIANKLMETYQTWLNEKNAHAYKTMADFLDQRLALAKKKLEQSEETIYKYGKTNYLVSVEDEIKNKLENVGNLDVRLADIESQIGYYQTLLTRLERHPEQAITFINLSTDSRIKEMTKAYDEINLQLRVSRKYFKPSHPKYIELLGKKNSIQRNLVGKLEESYQATIFGLQVTRKKKDRELKKYQAKLYRLQEKGQIYKRLKRELKTDEEMYLNLLNKFEASKVLEAKKSLVEVMMISPAVEPEKHVLPKRKRTLIVGAAFSFFMAIFIAVLKEKKKEIILALRLNPETTAEK